jgi:hypothetical protein
MNALYRRRSELDDRLLRNLIEFSLASYTRVRRQAQSVMQSIFGVRCFLHSIIHSLSYGLLSITFDQPALLFHRCLNHWPKELTLIA